MDFEKERFIINKWGEHGGPSYGLNGKLVFHFLSAQLEEGESSLVRQHSKQTTRGFSVFRVQDVLGDFRLWQ